MGNFTKEQLLNMLKDIEEKEQAEKKAREEAAAKKALEEKNKKEEERKNDIEYIRTLHKEISDAEKQYEKRYGRSYLEDELRAKGFGDIFDIFRFM